MRWNRSTVQPFLTVRVHVLNNTLEHAFQHVAAKLSALHNFFALRTYPSAEQAYVTVIRLARDSGLGRNRRIQVITARRLAFTPCKRQSEFARIQKIFPL